MSTDAMKQALEQTLEMLSDNREYIEANERSDYLAMYDKAIAGAEKALAEQPAPAAQPAQYPEGDVVGPCVCGSWPGGKCLKCPRIKRPAQQWPMTDEMVTAAARALNKRQAEACCVDKNDHWKFYGDDIKEDARAVLEAAHGITKGNT